MDYQVSKNVYYKVLQFYSNVARKYRHTYSYEDIRRDYSNAIYSIRQIENGLTRRKPRISSWQKKGLHMATSKDRRWNFAYKIAGDTVYVEDVCHSQNIQETTILSEAEVAYNSKA